MGAREPVHNESLSAIREYGLEGAFSLYLYQQWQLEGDGQRSLIEPGLQSRALTMFFDALMEHGYHSPYPLRLLNSTTERWALELYARKQPDLEQVCQHAVELWLTLLNAAEWLHANFPQLVPLNPLNQPSNMTILELEEVAAPVPRRTADRAQPVYSPDGGELHAAAGTGKTTQAVFAFYQIRRQCDWPDT